MTEKIEYKSKKKSRKKRKLHDRRKKMTFWK